MPARSSSTTYVWTALGSNCWPRAHPSPETSGAWDSSNLAVRSTQLESNGARYAGTGPDDQAAYAQSPILSPRAAPHRGFHRETAAAPSREVASIARVSSVSVPRKWDGSRRATPRISPSTRRASQRLCPRPRPASRVRPRPAGRCSVLRMGPRDRPDSGVVASPIPPTTPVETPPSTVQSHSHGAPSAFPPWERQFPRRRQPPAARRVEALSGRIIGLQLRVLQRATVGSTNEGWGKGNRSRYRCGT